MGLSLARAPFWLPLDLPVGKLATFLFAGVDLMPTMGVLSVWRLETRHQPMEGRLV